MQNDDMALVHEYVARQSEPAFEALVGRHVGLVYSAAIRQVRDPHLAEEITQAVFILLARKADRLGPDTILPAWLHRTAGFVAADALKTRRRRALREQEAHLQSQLSVPENETTNETWRQIGPLLDQAIATLNEKDRQAVVLRFFQNRSLREIGLLLGASEDAAKMRVNRALEKLRKSFSTRGVVLPVAALSAAISASSVQAAPATLAQSVTAIALTKGATASVSTLTLIQGASNIMAWAKMKTAVVVGTLILIGAGTTTLAFNRVRSREALAPVRLSDYATPESSIASMLRAAGRGGSLEKISTGFTPELWDSFKGRLIGNSDEETRQKCLSWANALAGYKITRTEVISDQEVRLHVTATPSPDGLPLGHTVVIMKKVGLVWKFAGNG